MRSLFSTPSSRKAQKKFLQFGKFSSLHNVDKVFAKFFLYLIACCILVIPAAAFGEVRTVHAEWSYTTVSGLAGFKLYKDGNFACQTNDPSARAIDCSVDITSSPVSLTMTAFDTAGNESGHSAPYSVTVQTGTTNQLPTANISANTLLGDAPLLVSFSGTGSSDPDGSISSYAWNFGDGQTATGSMAVHTFRAGGVYTVSLTVTDNDGGQHQATTTVTARANQSPVASISANVITGDAPLLVGVDGGGSSDPDGSVVSYAWNFGDGSTATGRTAVHTFTSTGIYSVTLRVTDDKGATAQTTKAITVTTASVSSGVQQNIAPLVTLEAYHVNDPNTATRIIVADGSQGMVDLVAYGTDLNTDDVLTFNWAETQNVLLVNGTITPDVSADGQDVSIFTFDPSGVVPGVYKIKVTATDNGTSAASTTAELSVEVVDSAPVLSGTLDSDGDGIMDADEGFADSDNDGIPNYRDAISDTTMLQAVAGETDRWLLMTEPGLSLHLGTVAFASGNYTAGVTDTDIALNSGDGSGTAVSTSAMPTKIFDFQVVGLSQPGQSVKVVLPQLDAIPANPVYRKYFSDVGWTDYTIDAQNQLASAAGALGQCPPPGDSAYTAGLTAGNYCVQLTIQDGGPNDSDGLANGIIDDPSGVAQLSSSTGTSSSAGIGSVAGAGGGGCSIDKDANDPMLALLLLVAGGAYLVRRKGQQVK